MSDLLGRRRRLDVHQERLELRRLGIGIANEGRKRVRTPAFPRHTHETPMQGNPHDMDGLAVAHKWPDTFGHHRLRLDRTALGPDAYPAAQLDTLLLRKLFRDLDEE